MSIVVTGGCGYIGSHVSARLLAAGYEVLILDDFSNCRADVPERIAKVSPRAPRVKRVDVTRRGALACALADVVVDGVIHLAGRKAVAESVADPLGYYRVNVGGTLNIREAAGACPFVFSSSATVYGVPSTCPIEEDTPPAPVNPYGASKAMAERVLLDAAHAQGRAGHLVVLRYFNPIGAHESGQLGDDPLGAAHNLMPNLERVGVTPGAALTVHGTDYATRDGTAIRDYVHVMDLADAHVAALEVREASTLVLNLGSEQGSTVLEVVRAFEQASGLSIPLRLGPRREGDVPAMWASAARARAVLRWQPQRTLEAACEDAWRWRQRAGAAAMERRDTAAALA